MRAHITEIEIPRSAFLGGGAWRLRGLTAVTTLFGKNGSGKSLLLRAWRDQNTENIHYVTPERSGEMDLQPAHIAQEHDGKSRRGYSQKNYTPDYRRRIVARILTYFSHRGNYRDGESPAPPEDIERYVATLLPDFHLELDPSKTPPYQLTRSDGTQTVRSVDQLSSGEAQLLTVALDVLTVASIWRIHDRADGVMLIDEPDAHIHPDLQVRFADFICEVARGFDIQLVIATHSTSLLAALGNFGGNDASVVYLRRGHDEYTAQPFDTSLRQIAAALGGHALMGPLFGAPILLVEGDDDFRIWSQVPRHHVVNLAVIPCGGDEIIYYQRKLEDVLSSVSDADHPIGFALLDGDKNLPVPSETNPQARIQFIGLNCHEAENLYLTAEVLEDLGLTWEVAQQKLRAAEGYGQKTQGIRALATADRQHVDVKPYINELSRILDERNVHWTIRVGKAIGRQVPAGELRDFLGTGVVGALWN